MDKKIRAVTSGNDNYQIRLEGFLVNRCLVDYAISFEFTKERELAILRVESRFVCELEGQTWTLDPEEAPSLGPALGLLHRVVKSASLTSDGELQIRFADQASLIANVNPSLEAWTLNMPDGTLVVGGIGGEISVFQGPTEGRKSPDSRPRENRKVRPH